MEKLVEIFENEILQKHMFVYIREFCESTEKMEGFGSQGNKIFQHCL